MGRRFNKKNAQTFSVVHRAHDDALFFDNDASKHVLVPAPSKKKNYSQETTSSSRERKIYTTEELAQKLTPEEVQAVRENEGLAAQFGIFFDDSKYDYMQHLKPIGESNDGVFIEAKAGQGQEKKKLGNIEDLFKDQLPSKEVRNVTHDDFENIPQKLKGFNPDMDPRLREVLEALDDEEYIVPEDEDEGEEDIFANLLNSGQVDDEDFYYGEEDDDDYDEWDLDNYEEEYNNKYDSDNYQSDDLEEAVVPYNEGEAPEGLTNDVKISTNWQDDFAKFKKATKNQVNEWDSDDEEIIEEEENDVLPDLPAFDQASKPKKKSNTKARKKKGAMTDTTSFSMTSSALFRTEGLTLLDDRYEQLAKKFEDEEEPEQYQEFKMENERTDLESMLDDFLDNYELESGGRKLAKKNEDRKKIQEAADAASKGKVAAKRIKEREASSKDPLGKLGGSFGNLTI